jgi:CubicO group peptidase (beta-lactamase class C family)
LRRRPALRSALCAGAAIFAVATAAPAAGEAQGAGAVPANVAHAADRIAALAAFVDGAVAEAMRRDHIAGVGVAVVDHSAVLLAKGYGVAALSPQRDMTADTLTRIGSLSKTVVWIALLQLMEQHRIAMDDPINRYLPANLQVPDDGFAEPIRIRHLMTHTAGFEDTILGHMIIDDPHREMPVATYLARYRPRRALPPGQIAVYSNYGAALAAMIVTQVTQLPWEAYAEERILRPLGLRSATFRENLPIELAKTRNLPQPMNADSAAHLSEGFVWQEAQLRRAPDEYITHYAPAGALAASANDMTFYLQALLDARRFSAAGVLSEESVHALFEPSFSNARGFGAIHHGLFQFPFPDSRLALGHDGDTRYQHAIMLIVPSVDLGIFVAVNTDGGLPLVQQLPYLIGEYLEDRPRRILSGPAAAKVASLDVEGTYRPLRRAYFRTERALLGFSTTSVERAANGELLITGLLADVARFTPTEEGDYREVDGHSQIAFRLEGGHLLLLDPTGANPLERIGFFAGPRWLVIIVALSLLAALLGTIHAVRNLRDRASADWWDIVPSLWLAAFVIAASGVAPWVKDIDSLATNYPGTLFPVACWMFFLATLSTVVLMPSLFATRSRWVVKRRLFAMFSTLLFLFCAGTFYHWGLLGFSGW